jgi:hypothetical protein
MKEMREEEKKLFKEYFNEWLNVKDSIKELNEDAKGFIEQASDLCEVKKPVVSKLFNFLKKKVEDDNTELDTLFELSETIGM